MTYQVLARKWRPRSFADLVGQEHVVRALVNGLERGQLHHAYLLTGTRGVGKTTLARILAKTLNCEQGVGPEPCGVCATCSEIDAGRFVDLLEVDAASRTKVDQTRELLDNVPFAPVRGRYKVYLIDEVHMFSASSFNALLKTLEEPPDHVKFVLATTDPQKLPATVLSRCLQFNLKRLLPEQIRDRFATVLEAEGIGYEPAALNLVARAADGSMRDGLSLLDQAVAFGAGRITLDDVRAMLGTYGRQITLDLLEAMAAGDAARLLAEVGRAAELTPDFSAVLEGLIGDLHRIALAQQIPETRVDEDPDDARLLALSARMPVEDVQLYYQVCLTGQQDLALAPDPRIGLEMVLLRALAFRPAEASALSEPSPSGDVSASKTPVGTSAAEAGDGQATSGRSRAAAESSPPSESMGREQAGAVTDAGCSGSTDVSARPGSAPGSAPALEMRSADDWESILARVDLKGLALELARHCAFQSWDGRRLTLGLAPGHLHLKVAAAEQRLGVALAQELGSELRLEIVTDASSTETPAQRRARDDANRLADAERALQADPMVARLCERFDAEQIPGSVRVLHT
jgi:DNA polymerase-3 subunit gamma/tau